MKNNKGWEMVKLGEVCTVVRGSSPRPQGSPEFYNGPIPRLMIEDLTRDGMFVTPKVDSLTIAGAKLSRPMKKGDLVITVSGRTGIPAILNIDCCIHDGFAGLRNLSYNIYVNYLYYYLSSLTAVTSQQAVGAIFKNLTTEQLKDLLIPLPPLPEQQRIAALLDAADALRRKDKALLQKYEELAQSVFMDMFGDPVKNEKGWEVVELGEVSNIISGYAFKSDGYIEDKNEIKLCGGICIDPQKINWEKCNYWPKAKAEGLDNFFLENEDIVLAMDRPWISSGLKIAKISTNDLPSLLVQRTTRLRGKSKNWSNFIYYLLQENAFKKHCKITETTVPHISPNDIKTYKIPKPDDSMVQKFDYIIKYIDLELKKMNQNMIFSDALFSSLLQEAFGGS